MPFNRTPSLASYKMAGGDKAAVDNKPKAEAPAVEEEELQDPMIAVRENCQQKSECKKYRDRLDECTERVNNTPGTSETCTEELFDFLHCVDHCIAHSLFSKLK